MSAVSADRENYPHGTVFRVTSPEREGMILMLMYDRRFVILVGTEGVEAGDCYDRGARFEVEQVNFEVEYEPRTTVVEDGNQARNRAMRALVDAIPFAPVIVADHRWWEQGNGT
jgi:hypothetical protein